jgi:hypothetical protein
MNQEESSLTDREWQQLVEDAKRVLTQSKAESQRITRRLAESREVIDRVTRVLRRAGYHV